MSPVMPELMTLDPALRAKIETALAPDERVLWVGWPSPGRMARRGLRVALFGIVWMAVIVFVALSRAEGPLGLGALWRRPFLALAMLGLVMLYIPVPLMRQARRTVYVLTNRRTIYFGGGAVHSAALTRVSDIRVLKEYSDGSGDLVWHAAVEGEGGWTGRRGKFAAVPNVRQVERILREAVRARAP